MILNQHQLEVTQRKLQALNEELTRLEQQYQQDSFYEVYRGSVRVLIADMEAETADFQALWGSLPFGQIVKLEAPLEELGLMLIRLRIARGISQKELAQRMGVRPQQVQQDEENEYHSLTVGRLKRILEALEVKAEVRLAA